MARKGLEASSSVPFLKQTFEKFEIRHQGFRLSLGIPKEKDAMRLIYLSIFIEEQKKRLIPTEQFSRFLKKCTVEMNKNTFSEKLYSKNERRNRGVWMRDESLTRGFIQGKNGKVAPNFPKREPKVAPNFPKW